MSRDKTYVAAPLWDDDRLAADAAKGIEDFREERMREPLEDYLKEHDAARTAFENLLEETIDLTAVEERALDLLTDEQLLEALRYLPGPPISEDDLKVIADASLAPKKLNADPEMAKRIIDTVMAGLDRQRFPWVREDRDPTEHEKDAAILASAALVAMRHLETARRNVSKDSQEERVRQVLLDNGFKEVPRRIVTEIEDAPLEGEFCGESEFGPEKADFIVGLHDRRKMPIECKVSNSYLNSIKRLNKDAAKKADEWRRKFGSDRVVPTAVLSGVFKVRHLKRAQNQQGLTIFWAHDLQTMIDWINSLK